VSKLVASAIVLGLGCAAALANDAPFAPVPDVPDYIATFAVKPTGGPSRIDSRTVTRRGEWARTDSEFNRHRATTYARIGDALTVRIQGDPASVPSYTQLTILRGAKEHRSPGWNYDSFKTGEQDVIVGEPCEIWNTARTDHPSIKTELKRLSCVTQDGIELRYRFVATAYDGTFAEATSLVRRRRRTGRSAARRSVRVEILAERNAGRGQSTGRRHGDDGDAAWRRRYSQCQNPHPAAAPSLDP
jgi:hypothetical protein